MQQSLGNTLKEYGFNPLMAVQYVVMAVVTVIFVATFIPIGSTGPFNSTQVLLLAVGGIIIVLTLGLALRLVLLWPRLHIYEGGVGYSRGNTTEYWRWSDFTQYNGMFAVHKLYGVVPLVGYGAYTFVAPGKPALKITYAIASAQDAITLLMKNHARLHLPASLKAYEAGETLRFGKLTLNREGAHLGGRTLPISALAGGNFDSDSFFVVAKDKKRGLRTATMNVDNRMLAVAVLNRVARADSAPPSEPNQSGSKTV